MASEPLGAAVADAVGSSTGCGGLDVVSRPAPPLGSRGLRLAPLGVGGASLPPLSAGSRLPPLGVSAEVGSATAARTSVDRGGDGTVAPGGGGEDVAPAVPLAPAPAAQPAKSATPLAADPPSGVAAACGQAAEVTVPDAVDAASSTAGASGNSVMAVASMSAEEASPPPAASPVLAPEISATLAPALTPAVAPSPAATPAPESEPGLEPTPAPAPAHALAPTASDTTLAPTALVMETSPSTRAVAENPAAETPTVVQETEDVSDSPRESAAPPSPTPGVAERENPLVSSGGNVASLPDLAPAPMASSPPVIPGSSALAVAPELAPSFAPVPAAAPASPAPAPLSAATPAASPAPAPSSALMLAAAPAASPVPAPSAAPVSAAAPASPEPAPVLAAAPAALPAPAPSSAPLPAAPAASSLPAPSAAPVLAAAPAASPAPAPSTPVPRAAPVAALPPAEALAAPTAEAQRAQRLSDSARDSAATPTVAASSDARRGVAERGSPSASEGHSVVPPSPSQATGVAASSPPPGAISGVPPAVSMASMVSSSTGFSEDQGPPPGASGVADVADSAPADAAGGAEPSRFFRWADSELPEVAPEADQVVRVFCGVWNLHGKQPPADLTSWLPLTPRHHVYIVGTCECERSIQMSLIWANKARWEQQVRDYFGPEFRMIGSHNMSAIHLMVFAHRYLWRYCWNAKSCQVATGFGNLVGNKGGTQVGFCLGHTSILCVNAHLAAHQSKMKERTQSFQRILVENPMKKNKNGFGVQAEFDRVFFMGDLNARVDATRDDVDEWLAGKDLEKCLQRDQLIPLLQSDAECVVPNGNCPAGMWPLFDEAKINFFPTYKYDTHSNHYDSSKKRRVPSWTDRILWRRDDCVRSLSYDAVPSMTCSDHRPVFAQFEVSIDCSNWHGPPDDVVRDGKRSGVCSLQ
eukprot:TRINITY_DN3449_c0_g1_i1.p1 TRINITY_DN3449_c0_g1~~TRINITY_DN3449_c0_g1_i1.p1  ORF type:complete len:927 (+),score=218.33 TRINITY_DN3449_c0_g1_i1:79-2859(+)